MNAQLLYLKTIEGLLEENEVEKALDALLEFDEKAKAGIRQDIILQAGGFREAARFFRNGLIGFPEYSQVSARTRFGLLEIMKEVPERVERDAQVRDISAFQFNLPDNARLEKVIGQNNLLKINWLEAALRAAKSVCRVVCEDGEMGTGFLTQDGYLFTNNHVIPSAEIAAASRIEFNYELDASGSLKSRISYKLNASDFITSNPDNFDFARVKIIDRSDAPLSQWGYVEFETEAIPVKTDAVTIIQHPEGEDKQIALNANDVLSVWGKYLFYDTDTKRGSSGSPVFNREWKVVAIHHAGRTEEEGGLTINAKGEKKAANRGILFRDIFEFINLNKQAAPKSAVPIPPSGSESFRAEKESIVFEEKPPQVPQNQVINAIPHLVILSAKADAHHAKNLAKHLNVMVYNRKITLFDVQKNVPLGTDFQKIGLSEIAKSKMVLVLVTPELFAESEILELLQNTKNSGRPLVPVLVERMDIQGTGLEKLQSVPAQGKFIADFGNLENAWHEVAVLVGKAVV